MRSHWTPSRRQVLVAGGLSGVGLGIMGGVRWTPSNDVVAERAGTAFGTTVKIKARHSDKARLEAALDAAWNEISAVETAASLYRPSSALSRLNRDGVVENPPPVLVGLLQAARRAAHLTDGAFDVTVQPLWQAYAAAAAAGRTPSEEELAQVRPLVGEAAIEMTPQRIAFSKPGMSVTLNGIAQGYATSQVLSALAAHGIADAFLDTGEIGVSGTRDGDQRWTAAIADPRNAQGYVSLARPLAGVLATSGDYATTFTPDFSSHHIFDPMTLHSPSELASVSVLSPDGAMADALATAMMVMGSKRSLELASRLEGVEIFLMTKDGRYMRSPGFPVA